LAGHEAHSPAADASLSALPPPAGGVVCCLLADFLSAEESAMEGCLVRAVRLLALFIVFVCLAVTADCVAGFALRTYWPTWEEDLSTWGEDSLSTPTATPEEAWLDRTARRRIQRRLRDEGFEPGAPDGLFGPRTRAAIRDWQRSRGAPQTGYLNGTQALELTDSAEPPAATSNGGDVVRSEFFTLGSHANDVLRIQGTPTRISTYSDFEVWGYGLSTVTISTRSREVIEWSDFGGNLRVRLEPRGTEAGGGGDRLPVPPLAIPGQRDERVYELGDGVEIPRVLRNANPSYTAAALRQGLQGTVVVEAVVLPDGSVGDVTVLTMNLGRVNDRTGLWEDADQGETFGLDEAAIRAARRYSFVPGTRLGEPVAMPVTIEFYFSQ